jgi:hypothetical protein
VQALRAEIDQETDLEVVGFQVIDRLRQMNILQLRYSLDLDHHRLCDEEVNAPRADFDAAILDIHLVLAAEFEALLRHLDSQRTLVDPFLKPVAKCSMHRHHGSNDLTGQLGMQVLLGHCDILPEHG